MAPTEILARQHFNLAKKLLPKNVNIRLISGNQNIKIKKKY
jgi:ATP-dependent DNA helicase RecG